MNSALMYQRSYARRVYEQIVVVALVRHCAYETDPKERQQADKIV